MKKGIIITTILILSITTFKVKADTFYNSENVTWYTDTNTTQLFPTWQNTYSYFSDSSVSTSTTVLYTKFYTNELDLSKYKGSYIEIPYILNVPVLEITLTGNSNTEYMCKRWTEQSSGAYACTDYDTYTTHTDTSKILTPNVWLSPYLEYSDGSKNVCTIDINRNIIHCPVKYQDNIYLKDIRFDYKVVYDNYDNGIFRLGLGNIINMYVSDISSIIESQQICDYIDKNKIIEENSVIATNGNILNNWNGYGVTDYIIITENSDLTLISQPDTTNAVRTCFYNINKEKISCISTSSETLGKITIPNNSKYIRITILISQNKPTYKLCQNGNQAIMDKTFDDTASTDTTNETNTMGNYTQMEESIMNSLDFSAIGETNITINPNASYFIWNLADRLRQMSSAIVLLMTSIFGIGLIKLVLNR